MYHTSSRLQMTPASSVCLQLCLPIPLCVQSKRLDSFPVHRTSSRRMGPIPSPKLAATVAVTVTSMKTINTKTKKTKRTRIAHTMTCHTYTATSQARDFYLIGQTHSVVKQLHTCTGSILFKSSNKIPVNSYSL